MEKSIRYLLLLVRSGKDVPRACREVKEFLEFRDARFSAAQDGHEEQFVGMWVDPLTVNSPPELLGGASASDRRAFRNCNSFGLSGIWLLCWLDALHAGNPADLGAIRERLVLALAEQQTCKNSIPKFAPIFDAADESARIFIQTERLRLLFPELIHEPLTWNRPTGALTHASEFRYALMGSEH